MLLVIPNRGSSCHSSDLLLLRERERLSALSDLELERDRRVDLAREGARAGVRQRLALALK